MAKLVRDTRGRILTDSLGRRLSSEPPHKFNIEVVKAVSKSVKKPSYSTLLHIDNLISELKESGIWSKFDIFALFQLNDDELAEFALYDYKRGVFFTAGGGMIYDEFGYQGNGIDGYINTNFNPATSGVNYTLNNASRGAWISKEPSGTGLPGATIDISSNTPGSGGANRLINDNIRNQRINQGNSNLDSAVDLSGLGLKVINRDDDTNVRLYNNITETNRTATSTSVNNATQLLLTSSNGYVEAGLGFYFMGASLTAQNVSDLRTAYLTYLAKIGL